MLEIVSYSWYQSQPWIRTQNIRIWRKFFGFSGKTNILSSFGFFPYIQNKIFLHIWNVHEETITTVGGRSPETTARAPTRSTRHQASRRVRSTRQLLQRIADVIDDVSLPSQQRAVSGADVSMTWLLTRQMTSACPVSKLPL